MPYCHYIDDDDDDDGDDGMKREGGSRGNGTFIMIDVHEIPFTDEKPSALSEGNISV